MIREGLGKLSAQTGEIVTFTAPQEPGLCILEAVAAQGDTVIRAEATITVITRQAPRNARRRGILKMPASAGNKAIHAQGW